MNSRVLHVAAVITTAVTMASGCTGGAHDRWKQRMPRTYRAYGAVTYRGKPLGGATVVFHPLEGAGKSRRTAAGVTDSSGRFILTTVKPRDGAAAGAYRVTVEKTTPPNLGAISAAPDETVVISPEPGPSATKPLIPEKYFAPETSGLAAEIKPSGKNDFSFTLE